MKPSTLPGMQSAARRVPQAAVSQVSDREPRVLFVTHTGKVGGAETCLLNIVSVFKGTVMLFEDGALHARLLELGAQVLLPRRRINLRGIRRDRGLLMVLPALPRLVGLLRDIRRAAMVHDVLYCNSQKGFVLGAAASWLTRTPLLWHLHDILDSSHFARPQIGLVVALANRRASRVLAPSRAVADAFIAAGGRPSAVTIVPNGVVPCLDGTPEQRTDVRSRIGLPPGFVYGVFSRLASWKGQAVALQALAHLPDASCVIAGDALFGEEQYARSLRILAERLGVSDRVRFLGHRDDVPALMQAVDVVVHPSIHPEPFGLTLVEAMMSGTPIVAARGGAVDEILQDGRLGMLSAPGDALALARAIEACRGRSESVLRQVREARRHAERHFTVERLRRRVRDVVFETARDAGRPLDPVCVLP